VVVVGLGGTGRAQEDGDGGCSDEGETVHGDLRVEGREGMSL
jgi:hypothetical protein